MFSAKCTTFTHHLLEKWPSPRTCRGTKIKSESVWETLRPWYISNLSGDCKCSEIMNQARWGPCFTSLNTWLLKVCFLDKQQQLTWELTRNAEPWASPHCRSAELESAFHSICSDHCVVKFEKHFSRALLLKFGHILELAGGNFKNPEAHISPGLDQGHLWADLRPSLQMDQLAIASVQDCLALLFIVFFFNVYF